MTVKIVLKREAAEGIRDTQVTAEKEKDTSDVTLVLKDIVKKD